MIITDGIITDMEKTIDEVVKGSDLPLSIVIVGVGDCDFGPMDRLDGDEEPVYSKTLGRYWSRDIVQFVPYNEVKHDKVILAKKTLEEIPYQLVEYFSKRGIYPMKAT